MAITVNYPIDELVLDDLIDFGYTTLKLYYSNAPEGPFVDSGTVPIPATLAAIEAAGTPYTASFLFPTGNGAQWFKVLASDGSAESSLNDAQTFHGGGGTTLQSIREKTGALTNTMHVGETTSNGASDGSTAIASSAKFRRFRDKYFGGGAGIDGWFFLNLDTSEWTVISDWDQSTGTFHFSPALAAQVNSGTRFEVMARWTPDEYRDGINWAISYVFPTLSKPVVDTNTVTEDDIFVYTIPFNIRILNKIEIEQAHTNEDSTDSRTRGQPWRQIAYDLVDDGLVRTVEFKRELDAGRRLRFTGTSMLSRVYNDSDYVEAFDPQIDLIAYVTAFRLYSLLTNTDAASDIDRFRDLATSYLTIYQENIKRQSSRRKSKKIWSHDAKWNSY